MNILALSAGTLYTLFIWPIRFVLEFLFVLFNRIFDAPGASVIFLSAVVNTLTLPLYAIADRWQREERELQGRMREKLDRIRRAFKGDERQMIIRAYYRQMAYSPLFPLKASAGLLLQIPFFIAAYQFLSQTSMLSGASFLFLRDLNAQDLLIPLSPPFGGEGVNLLPFVMTAVNLAAAFLYARKLGKREMIQLFAMALVFLVLLYNSPSGLVLYWTMNNVYSLVKNAAQGLCKKPGRVLRVAVSVLALAFIVLIWSGEADVERYRGFFTCAALGLAGFPFLWRFLVRFFAGGDFPARGGMGGLYFSALALLFLLLGFLNPAQVLSASAADFEAPWLFLWRTILQGAAFLILIPLFIRALAPPVVRRILAAAFSALALCSVVCFFILSKSYGVMDRNFKLDDTERLINAFPPWVSVAVPLCALGAAAALLVLKKERFLTFFFRAACAALLVLGCVNLAFLGGETAALAKLAAAGPGDRNQRIAAVFPLSRTETNVFIVFLDRAQGTAMTDALKYMPSLGEELEGFTFYPNTLSFGGCTVTGVPAMLGGYAYTPLAINERGDQTLVDKVNGALTFLPRLFGEAGYRVTITDPVIANMRSVPDVSPFSGMPNVSARLLSGKLAGRFREEFPPEDGGGEDAFDFDILFRYGLFRAAPPALRWGIYYKGQWWREAAYNSYGRAVAEFSSLYYLPQLCSVDGGGGTLNIFMNAVTHESGAYGPGLFPQSRPPSFSGGEIALYGSRDNAEYMYTFLAAARRVVEWVEDLKRREVYDNTRIIVVSDHGGHYDSAGPFTEMEGHNPLLMVKEPGERGPLRVSRRFMTHADTPDLAANALIPPPAGGGDRMDAAEAVKRGRIFAVSEVSSQPLRHGPYRFKLDGIRELKGREVLRRDSWGDWERVD
ncbi:MAG: YidC/Oxa1 family membrane protein insertase [Treponema sp.]|nr:YidC/Oxa1 family membrane protein insertase [Treponema sp.]